MDKGDWVIILFVIVFFTFIGYVFVKQVEEKEHIRETCVKTDMIVIGNKGHVTPVYRCGGELN